MNNTEVIRVGVQNNFNCTCGEFAQLRTIAAKRRKNLFFINSNILTINRQTAARVNANPYKIVVTINPDLTVDWTHLDRLALIDKDKVAFVRVKYLPNNAAITALCWALKYAGYTPVLTLMRFRTYANLEKFTEKKYYHREGVYSRLNDEYVPRRFLACDRKHLGCGSCGLCAKLSYNSKAEIRGLSLSSSGLCPHNCVECFAKFNMLRATAHGGRPIKYDEVIRNAKMKGELKYMQDHRQAEVSGARAHS